MVFKTIMSLFFNGLVLGENSEPMPYNSMMFCYHKNMQKEMLNHRPFWEGGYRDSDGGYCLITFKSVGCVGRVSPEDWVAPTS